MVFEDRVAKYPGRWTMVKSDGTSEIVTLIRNDEPTKEGTPINAATLNELSTVAGAINAKEESISAAQAAASERAKAEQAATNSAKSEKNSKASETESAKNLQGTKEYFEQVRTITIGAQGWYATPEALKTAVPVGENGWWAVVGTTDTIWTWDSDTGAWKDSVQKADLSDYYTREQVNRLLEVQKLADHPVGSIYQSTDPTSPAALFGGTWEQIASDRVLMGASRSHAAGTTVKAGLPNITGSLSETSNDGKTTPFRGNKNAISSIGALAVTEASSPFCGYAGYEGSAYDISFDASRSNSIYGRSATVQPAAYYVHIWRRVA
nr:MAG TPA: baseplate protein [Caudoviricetes sp.]